MALRRRVCSELGPKTQWNLVLLVVWEQYPQSQREMKEKVSGDV